MTKQAIWLLIGSILVLHNPLDGLALIGWIIVSYAIIRILEDLYEQ